MHYNKWLVKFCHCHVGVWYLQQISWSKVCVWVRMRWWWCSRVPYVHDVALCGNTVRNMAIGLWLVLHPWHIAFEKIFLKLLQTIEFFRFLQVRRTWNQLLSLFALELACFPYRPTALSREVVVILRVKHVEATLCFSRLNKQHAF